MTAIRTEQVRKEYNGHVALEALSFEVPRGAIFGLLGPNGAGKTTLLRMLTGILRPDSGQVRVLGREVCADTLARVGYMPEERGLYRDQNALDTIAYFATLKGLGRREARADAERALEAVGMAAHGRRRINELSKGMSQRVQLAATIAHRPELLILDEPFSGLDPVSALDLQEVIRAQRAAGVTILLSTHNMEHAERLCDGLLMLHKGRVRLSGGMAEVRRRFTDETYRVELAGALPPLTTCTARPDGQQWLLTPTPPHGHRDILTGLTAANADILRFEPVVPTLEEIFVRVAGEEARIEEEDRGEAGAECPRRQPP